MTAHTGLPVDLTADETHDPGQVRSGHWRAAIRDRMANR